MGLTGKFSLLLSGCVILAVLLTTAAATRFFTADQESSLIHTQTERAVQVEKRLTEKFDLLHAQVKAVLDAEPNPLARLAEALPALKGAQLWDEARLLGAIPPSYAGAPPPSGNSEWALVLGQEPGAVRWLGRYGAKTVSLLLAKDWFDEIPSDRGIHFQLALPTGDLLVTNSNVLKGEGVFAKADLEEQWRLGQPGMPRTRKYETTSGDRVVGTSLLLPLDPPVLFALHTSTSAISRVIWRTYRYTAGIAVGMLFLTIAAGMIFSAGLTRPLRALDQQTRDIAQGKFDLPVVRSASRKDEVGSLARSFARMGQDLKKLRDELQRSERLAALGKFSASIAHEIKNPLGGILINTQLAEEQATVEPLDREALKETLGFVREETWRADRIVQSLMKFARHDRPQLKELNLSDRLKRSLSIMRGSLVQAEVHLDLRLADTPITIRANEDQIHEVIVNLAQNAVHAMKDCNLKQLTVSLSETPTQVVLEIGDSGHGMTEDIKTHLFEPFFTTKPIGEGTGLGLSVCHGIVRSHGGRIEVESEPGKGTRFLLIFPRAENLMAA